MATTTVSGRPRDEAIVPGAVHAAIAATALINARTHGSSDPVERGLAAVEALWEQGYVIVNASHHLQTRALQYLPVLFIGLAIGFVLDDQLHHGTAAILLFALGASAGAVLRGLMRCRHE